MDKRLAIAAMILAAAACHKQEAPISEPATPEENEPVEATAVFTAITEGTDSKTTLSEDGDVFHVLWADGDIIDINGTQMALVTDDNPSGYGPGTTKAFFAGKNPAQNNTGAKYKAVYPATLRDKYGYYNLPAEQSYVPGTPAAFPMYAESDDASLGFKNLCGIIQLNLKGSKSVSAIALADVGDSPRPMSGRFTVAADAAVISSGTNGTSIVCSTPVALNTENFTSFYLSVPAGTYGKLSINIEASDGSLCTLKSKNPVTVVRSSLTPINLSSLNFKDETNQITYVMYDDYTGSTGNTGTYQYPGGADASVFGEGLTVVSHTYDPSTKTGVITLSGTVTQMGYYAFRGASYIKSITIPNTVTSIGERAFGECGRLESLNIPRGVTTIGNYAFVNDYYFTVPDLSHITSIGTQAFYNVKAGTITIGESMTSIGNQAFSGSTVEQVIIDHMPASMGTSVFYNCDKLTSVEINDGTAIPGYTFNDCSILSSVIINADIETIYEGAFQNCDGLHSIVVPDSVTSIADYAFNGCDNLETITFPASLSTIGKEAFHNCKALDNVVFPESLTSIGQSAFEGCSSITSLSIPGNVTYFYRAFRYCTSLQSVTFPTSATFTKIADGAFSGCTNLTATSIPANVTKVQQNAFSDCGFTQMPEGWGRQGLSYDSTPFYGCPITSITFPDNWTSVPQNFCSHMPQLQTVNLGTGIITLGAGAFSYCTSLNGGSSFVIPPQVTNIGGDCFRDSGFTVFPEGMDRGGITMGNNLFLNSAFTSVEINGWGTVPGYCFRSNRQLKSVKMDGVTTVGGSVFIECSALEEVDFGDDITSIGYDCFNGADALKTIIIRNTSAVCTLATRLRASTSAPMPLIYVPASLVDSYKGAAAWSQYASYILPLGDESLGGGMEDYNNGGNL